MNLSAERLEHLYEQRRKPTGKKNAATADWTDARCDQLTELWASGLSCSQIAEEMGGGITRNAVIGKVHRLKLPARKAAHHKSNLRYMRHAKPAPKKKAPKKPVGAFQPGLALPILPVMLPGDTEALKGNAWAPLPGSAPRSLLAVSADNGCRWPIGEEKPYAFCGEAIHRGVYCRAHAARAFRAVEKVDLRPTGKSKDIRVLDLEAV